MDIRYFRQGRREPVKIYLQNLSVLHPEVMSRILISLEILATEGTHSTQVKCRSMGNGLWELKKKSKKGSHRIFFCISESTIWLLHAFTKKTKKTPIKELDVVRRRFKEVFQNE